MRVAALICLCVDYYPQHDNALRIGGNSLNVAVQCLRSGADSASLLGAVGDDDNGDRVLEYLAGQGIDASHVRRLPGRTASNRNSLSSDGDKQQHLEKWDGGVLRDFVLTDADRVFLSEHDAVAAMWVEPSGRELLADVDRPYVLAMDFFEERDADALAGALASVDMGFLNGTPELANALQPATVGLDAPMVVTLGRAGSVGLLDGRRHVQEAIAIPQVVDAVGCGDAYMGAFMMTWLREHDLPAAMLAGAEAGAECASRLGPV